jgi:hypothetical protein
MVVYWISPQNRGQYGVNHSIMEAGDAPFIGNMVSLNALPKSSFSFYLHNFVNILVFLHKILPVGTGTYDVY